MGPRAARPPSASTPEYLQTDWLGSGFSMPQITLNPHSAPSPQLGDNALNCRRQQMPSSGHKQKSNCFNGVFWLIFIGFKLPFLVMTMLLSLQCLATLVIMLVGDTYTLINYVSFINYLCYGVTIIGLLVLRWKKPKIFRPIKVTMWKLNLWVTVALQMVGQAHQALHPPVLKNSLFFDLVVMF